MDDEHRIRSMGFNDSKQLTESKRDQLWEQLQECGFLGWEIRVLQAREISEGMLRKDAKYNLNAMSHDTAIGLVRKERASRSRLLCRGRSEPPLVRLSETAPAQLRL